MLPRPQVAVRTEPLGLDRHWRRYFWFAAERDAVFVEEAEGQSVATITSQHQLDAVIAGLNPKGTRERGLHAELRKYYEVGAPQVGADSCVLAYNLYAAQMQGHEHTPLKCEQMP